MSHANIYIRKHNEKAWEAIVDKSAYVNQQLEESNLAPEVVLEAKQSIISPAIAGTVIPKVIKTKEDALEAVKRKENKLLDNTCKGSHFMSRKDCGKPGCPWKGIV